MAGMQVDAGVFASSNPQDLHFNETLHGRAFDTGAE
jgi:hypothetical protein